MILRKVIAGALLLAAGALPLPGGAGELSFSDVNPFEIEALIWSGEPEKAVEAAEAAIAGLRPTDNPVTLRLIGEILIHLCEAHQTLGQHERARATCLESVATLEEAGKSNDMAEFLVFKRALPQLAMLLQEMGEIEEALKVSQRLLAHADNTRAGNPDRIRLLTGIGDLQLGLGDFRAAEASYLEAAKAREKIREEPQWFLEPRINLATLYRLEERFDKAEATLMEGLAVAEKTAKGKPEQTSKTGYDPLAFRIAFLSQSLGWALFHQRRLIEARTAARTALDYFERPGDADSWMANDVKVLLARIEDAENPGSPEARRYLESAAAAPLDDYIELAPVFRATAESELARHHLLAGEAAAATPFARSAVETLTSQLGEYSYLTARASTVLSNALHQQGKDTEALAAARAAYAAQWGFLPPYHSEIGETLALMAELYEALGDRENLKATRTLIADHKAARTAFENGN